MDHVGVPSKFHVHSHPINQLILPFISWRVTTIFTLVLSSIMDARVVAASKWFRGSRSVVMGELE